MPLNFIPNLEFDIAGPEIDYLENYSHSGLKSVHTHDLTDRILDSVLLYTIVLYYFLLAGSFAVRL